ncbi:MAG TPA: sigma factor-like helix-turn-helix DNA-binding protein [Candidatus Nanoarchaeia archaeon]|nr:sigma factor-like helix-turn-helix DNA-binding protein [Candidatus Nanoarchaeia archaeon]
MLTQKEIAVLELRAKKLTQIEVSKKLGISQAAVSHFEKNALRKIKEAEETMQTARKLKLTKE